MIKKHFEELTKKNNKNIDIEKIKKLFPEDENLHKHLDNIRKEFEERKKKRIDNFNKNRSLNRKNTGKNNISNSNYNISNIENEEKETIKKTKRQKLQLKILNDNLENNEIFLSDILK